MRNKKIIAKIAKETIRIEANTLNDLLSGINDSFIEAVEVIFGCKGRLIVTGIGKTAIVGKKMVATFNSTGTPAVFMHAADAIHGDLGIIQKDDIVLCVSKSGNTPELKVLMTFVKNFGNASIAMVSNPHSFLAQAATHILHVPVQKEADPNNLAPTASTTAQMALGDAIAMALLALRGFSARDFAQYHPGGALGKQLYLKVGDLVDKNDAPSVSVNAPLRQVILEMTSKRLGATAVLSQDGTLAGIITDGDLRRMLESDNGLDDIVAKDIMTRNPKTVDYHAFAVQALPIIRQHEISQLIAMDGNRYAGILHIHDLIAEGLL